MKERVRVGVEMGVRIKLKVSIFREKKHLQ